MKVTPYPILDSLKITHQVAYDLLFAGVESERVKYQMYDASGESDKAIQALTKVLYGEKILSFMRLNALALEKTNHLP